MRQPADAVTCPRCFGKGEIFAPCIRCGGSRFTRVFEGAPPPATRVYGTCAFCDGLRLAAYPCPTCDATGKVPRLVLERVLEGKRAQRQ
jgi:DnaJ-class molecular chaperone